MNLEDRRKGLLKLVDDYRERECRRVLDKAKAQARDLLQRTYRRERAHLHKRVVAERSRAQERVQAARAERATRERWTSERNSVELLAAAWPRVRTGLLDRWRDPVQRGIWVASCLSEGLKVLPRGLWTVRHAIEWAEAERGEPMAEVGRALGQEPGVEADGNIVAGLVIECGGAVLDASLDGLLRDRPRLEGRLLALLDEGSKP